MNPKDTHGRALLLVAVFTLADALLIGCGSPPDVTALDAAPDVSSSDATPEAAPVDAGAEAALEASPPDAEAGVACLALGGSCDSSADCWCGTGAGCGGLDNVHCSASGLCELAYQWPDTGALTCCEACEKAYQVGDAGLAEWQACSNGCGAAECPIRCLAQ